MSLENEEIWEFLQIESNVYVVGEPYPEEKFDFYIEGVSEKNLYCSNEGIKTQIQESLKLNSNREKVVYFFYKRIET
jgi:hypothetical protein